jgi:N-carbamoylputrescine amidase
MKIAFIQQANNTDCEMNLAYAEQEIGNAARQGAELVILQELFASLYFCQSEDAAHFSLAEPLDGPICQRMIQLARKYGVVIVASLFEKRTKGLFHNSISVIEKDGSVAGIYRKMHIPDDPGYYEKYYFTPGDLGFSPIHTSLGKLGVLVCWDQWFPEAARLMALSGADLLIYPTAIGWVPGDTQEEQQAQLDAWITVQRAHAIANNLPCVAVNRVGYEPDPSGHTDGIQFWGNSFVCRPNGQIVKRASADSNATEIVEIDLTESQRQRIAWPFLRDRRIEHYSGLGRLFIDRN